MSALQSHIANLEKYLPIELELKKQLKETRNLIKESKAFIQSHLQSNNLKSIQINDVIIKLKKNKSFNLSSKQLQQCKIEDSKKKVIIEKFTKENITLQY